MSDYLSEGINQAATARSSMSGNWADTWKNYAVQYALSKEANDQQLNLWNLMNEYNSPSAQMQRFKEAGLNPNLIYTQGTSGNASSAAAYSKPDVNIRPSSDRALQIQQASEVVSMVSNLAGNISHLIDQGLDVQLKKNQLALSDREVENMYHVYGRPGSSTSMNMVDLPEALNPLSSKFDARAFQYFSKNGQLPQFWNNYLSGVSNRALTDYRASYQDYYNTHLLPLFEQYQQGKVDIIEIEKELKEYNKTALEMLPPEIRGIISPLVQYLSPFLKFIFKRNTIKR